VVYETGGGTWFIVYRSQFAGTARSTSMWFEVQGVEEAVKELRERGIVFEEYDLPRLKTVKGIAETEGPRGHGSKIPTGTSWSSATMGEPPVLQKLTDSTFPG
jgi:hypothetical protein